jgi:TusA-related sulfurtransferase
MASLEPGQTLEVHTHVREHTFTVTAWARRMGLELIHQEEQGRDAIMLIRRPFPKQDIE